MHDELRPTGFQLFGKWTTTRGQASGGEAEQLFLDFLRKKGRHPESNPGGFHPEWDVMDEDFTYEVKYDRRVQETGNVYIEHKSLFNSKSDYLVYLFQRDITPTLIIFIAPSAKARNFYRRVKGERGIVGGDFKEPGDTSDLRPVLPALSPNRMDPAHSRITFAFYSEGRKLPSKQVSQRSFLKRQIHANRRSSSSKPTSSDRVENLEPY